MHYSATIFDLDGTLLDTSVGIKESVLNVLSQLNLPNISDEELDSFVGPPIQNSMKTHFGLSDIEAQMAANKFRNYYKETALYKAVLYDGISDLLVELRKQNIKIGVATYKREDYALSILNYFGIQRQCNVIYGADNENKLSKADIISKCIDELEISQENKIVMIGDTLHDAKGAAEAGIDFIGVTWGFGLDAEMDNVNYPMKGLANTPSELSKLIM